MTIAVVTAALAERAGQLGQAVGSVGAQTRPPDRHLVEVTHTREPEATVLNRLIRAAGCDAYLVLCDDDLLLPGCLKLCERALEGADIAYPYCRVEGRDEWSPNTAPFPGLPMTALIRTSLWEKLGGYRPRAETGVWADTNFYGRALAAGARTVKLPEELWVYRFHGENMSLAKG